MDNNRILNEKWEFVNCNLCGSNNFDNVCTYNEIKIVKCRTCGLIYRNPRLKEEMNREFYSYKYYGEYEGMEERISSARLYLFKKILLRLERKIKYSPRRLLDIGCGQGYFLKLAKDLGWQVEGVELAKSACDYARQRFGLNLINRSIEEAHFQESAFDVVTMWNVLDHLLDPLGILQEVRRILKPDGILVIRIPNTSFHIFIHKMFSLLSPLAKNKKSLDPSVIANYGFNSRTLRKILKKAGFQDVKIYNSPLSYGDPYKSFRIVKDSMVTIVKKVYFGLVQSLYYLSFGRCAMGTALFVFAQKRSRSDIPLNDL